MRSLCIFSVFLALLGALVQGHNGGDNAPSLSRPWGLPKRVDVLLSSSSSSDYNNNNIFPVNLRGGETDPEQEEEGEEEPDHEEGEEEEYDFDGEDGEDGEDYYEDYYEEEAEEL